MHSEKVSEIGPFFFAGVIFLCCLFKSFYKLLNQFLQLSVYLSIKSTHEIEGWKVAWWIEQRNLRKIKIFWYWMVNNSPFQENFKTCDQMHVQVILGVQWCLMCMLLSLKFYSFIKGIVRIYVVFSKTLRPMFL